MPKPTIILGGEQKQGQMFDNVVSFPKKFQ